MSDYIMSLVRAGRLSMEVAADLIAAGEGSQVKNSPVDNTPPPVENEQVRTSENMEHVMYIKIDGKLTSFPVAFDVSKLSDWQKHMLTAWAYDQGLFNGKDNTQRTAMSYLYNADGSPLTGTKHTSTQKTAFCGCRFEQGAGCKFHRKNSPLAKGLTHARNGIKGQDVSNMTNKANTTSATSEPLPVEVNVPMPAPVNANKAQKASGISAPEWYTLHSELVSPKWLDLGFSAERQHEIAVDAMKFIRYEKKLSVPSVLPDWTNKPYPFIIAKASELGFTYAK